MIKVKLAEANCYYDINLRFCIDNLRQVFEPWDEASQSCSETYVTEPFGPGWHIKCEHIKIGGEDYLSCHLVVGPQGYPAPITWTFSVTSQQGGVPYFRRSSTHLFVPEDQDGYGWSNVMSTHTWNDRDMLRGENAFYVTASIRARIVPAACSDKSMDLSYDAITAERPGDIEFVTFGRERQAGGDSRRRRLFASRDVLRETCPQLLDREPLHLCSLRV